MPALRKSWVTLSLPKNRFCYQGQLVDADLNRAWRCEHTHHRSREYAERCAGRKLKELQREELSK